MNPNLITKRPRLNTDKTLDHWDCLFVMTTKSSDFNIGKWSIIWGGRCFLEPKYVKLSDINRHLLNLAFDLGLIHAEFVMELDQTKNDWMKNMGMENKIVDFQTYLANQLAGVFSRTEVVRLPGYVEFLGKQ